MKKEFCLVLVVLFLFGGMSVTLAAAGTPQYTMMGKTVQAGEIFTVDVSIADNPGIISLRFQVQYDTSVLELQGVTDKALLNGFTTPSPTVTSPYTLRWADALATVNNPAIGTVATLTFRALRASASTAVTIRHEEARNCMGGKVTFNGATAYITVQGQQGGETPYIPPVIPQYTEPSVPQTQFSCPHADRMFHPAKDSTCLLQGNDAYYTCNSCGKVLSSDGMTEIPAIPSRPLAEHSFVNGVCRICGKADPNFSPATGTQTTEPPKETPRTPAASTWRNPFSDVSSADQHYEAIRYVCENGLFNGVSEREFAPDTAMTRAMFVTVLGRLHGIYPEYYLEKCFDDVPQDQWYSPYVCWASKNNIVNGYSETTFGLNDEITVEQAVAIFARYAQYLKEPAQTQSNSPMERYADAANVSAWAKSAMDWAVENGVYLGEGNNLLPKNKASRAVVAEMFYGFVNRAK